MINTHKYKDEIWVDIDRGTPEEIHELMDKYDIHPYVANEMKSETLKPRIEFHDEFIYCILHFPAWRHTHSNENKNQEVDFIIGKNALITARYDTIDALHKFAKDLEVNQILDKKGDATPARGHTIFTGMLRTLYANLFEELDYIEDVTEEITAKIWKGKEREMVIRISEITRTLLNFKRVTDLHKDILESLKERGGKIFDDFFVKEVELILIDYFKINAAIRSSLELLRELRETNNSLLSSKQNETVKNLTVIQALVLPLNLIAVIFAMRTEGMPLIDNPNSFWIVIGGMATIMLITYTYVKHKKLI